MQEKPTSQVVARSSAGYSISLAAVFRVAAVLCLVGLTLSVAMLSMIAPETIAWILSRIP